MEHRDDGSCERKSAPSARMAWRARSDRELIVAMRADVTAAFEEFIARYQPMLLARSRRFDMPQWEREDCVAEVLESMMLRLVRPDVRAPTEMAAYLTRMLHNRLVDVTRTRTARVAEAGRMADWSHAGLEGAVTALASRHAVTSCGADGAGTIGSLSPVLERLAHALIQPLSDSERQLIGWESNMIPHRTIAEWLGLSHAATTKRIWRLRTRLRELAMRYAESLGAEERVEIEHVIARERISATHRGSRTGVATSGTYPPGDMTGKGGTA